MTGGGKVTKAGSGTLTLSTANMLYSGFTATGGTVRAIPRALGGGAMSVSNTALFLLSDADAFVGDPANPSTNTTFVTDSTITLDRLTDGPGVALSLNFLQFNGTTLNVQAGLRVTGGTASLLAGGVGFSNNVTFNIGAGVFLSLGSAANPAGLVKTGPGTLGLGLQFSGTSNIVVVENGTVLQQTGDLATRFRRR